MTLQNTGPISLGNVQAEFGGTNPISMSEYRTQAGIPSGPISLSDFYGLSAVSHTIDTTAIGDTIIPTTGTAYAILSFISNGACIQQTSLGITSRTNWRTPTAVGAGASYEIRATQTVINGTGVASGVLGTWQSLSGDRTWTLQQVDEGIEEIDLAIDIRYASNSAVVASGTIHITASVGGF